MTQILQQKCKIKGGTHVWRLRNMCLVWHWHEFGTFFISLPWVFCEKKIAWRKSGYAHFLALSHVLMSGLNYWACGVLHTSLYPKDLELVFPSFQSINRTLLWFLLHFYLHCWQLIMFPKYDLPCFNKLVYFFWSKTFYFLPRKSKHWWVFLSLPTRKVCLRLNAGDMRLSL